MAAREVLNVFETDLVVNCAGGVPDLYDLDLDARKVTRSEHEIAVNDFMQSIGIPLIYAVGDPCGGGLSWLQSATWRQRLQLTS